MENWIELLGTSAAKELRGTWRGGTNDAKVAWVWFICANSSPAGFLTLPETGCSPHPAADQNMIYTIFTGENPFPAFNQKGESGALPLPVLI